MRIYLVGGALRDMLLQRPVKDRDYVVLHADEAALLGRFPQLKRVGGGPRGLQGVGHDADRVYLLGDVQYTLSPAQDIAEDLQGRDLTINALAMECDESGSRGPLVAHPQALQDIEGRLLRPVSVANFGQDPCRAVRAARFAAVLPGFAPAPQLFAAMRHALAMGLADVAAERVGQELRKACAGGAPGRFLAFLARGGCLSPWFAPFAGKPQLRLAAEQLMQRLAGSPAMWVYMAMCHHLPAEAALRMGHRLRLPGHWQQAGADAALLLPSLWGYEALHARHKVRLLLHCEQQRLLPALCALAVARYGPGLMGLRRRMEKDLFRVLAVRLPASERNRGPASGRALLKLRIQALEPWSVPGQSAEPPEQHEPQNEEDDQ